MGEYRINTAAPNLTSLCIDHVCNGEYSGRIYHKYQQEAVPFRESSQLISILDSFFDQINYPQASTKYRSFQKTKKEEVTARADRRRSAGEPGGGSYIYPARTVPPEFHLAGQTYLAGSGAGGRLLQRPGTVKAFRQRPGRGVSI